MTFSQKLTYFFIATITYVLLALGEIYFLLDFVSLIYEGYVANIIAITIMLIIFNPFITYKIMELVPFKVKGLKNKATIKDTLKQEN